MTIFNQEGSTLRTMPFRQVKPGTVLPLGVEVGVLTLWTTIMRWQRVNLRNPGEGGNHTGTNGTTGTNQVAILVRLGYQPLGNQVND